jgi:hypothetical protein
LVRLWRLHRGESLKPEETLDLAPDDDGQPPAERDEADQDDPEPQAGAAHLALSLTMSSPPGAVQAVSLLDCTRVELQRVFRIQSSRRLGHRAESKGACGPLSDT